MIPKPPLFDHLPASIRYNGDNHFDWQQPTDDASLITQLHGLVDPNIRYGVDAALGFPGSPPHPFAVRLFGDFARLHANNIGLHTTGRDAEHGFGGTQEIERQVVGMLAELLGGSLETVDGYLASGGTEGNMMGIRLGRGDGRSSAVFGSFLTHYSINKALDFQNIPTTAQADGTGYHVLPTNPRGQVLVDQLEESIRSSLASGVNHIVVVANAGTTLLGSVDDIPAISNLVGKLKNEFPNTHFHLHIDASFGGMVAPFVDGVSSIGFNNPHVDSVIVDMHKTGLAPYGMAVFMAKKGQFERAKTDSVYFPGGDATLLGSRPGINAVILWGILKKMGKEGFKQLADYLMQKKKHIVSLLHEAGLDVLNGDLTIVGVRGPVSPHIIAKYRLHVFENFPDDMTKVDSKRDTKVWNIVVMPTTSVVHVHDLLVDLDLRKPTKPNKSQGISVKPEVKVCESVEIEPVMAVVSHQVNVQDIEEVSQESFVSVDDDVVAVKDNKLDNSFINKSGWDVLDKMPWLALQGLLSGGVASSAFGSSLVFR